MATYVSACLPLRTFLLVSDLSLQIDSIFVIYMGPVFNYWIINITLLLQII